MGILKQLKDVKNDSQDVIKASTDAVSIIAAARSGLNKLKHGPQCNEETEWLNLSQDLKTIQSNNATTEVKVAAEIAESREKLNPEAPIEQDVTSTTYNNIVLPDSSLSINRDNEASRVYMADSSMPIGGSHKDDPNTGVTNSQVYQQAVHHSQEMTN